MNQALIDAFLKDAKRKGYDGSTDVEAVVVELCLEVSALRERIKELEAEKTALWSRVGRLESKGARY